MRISSLKNVEKGWFIGDFPKAAYRTDVCEVAFKSHIKGEHWPVHYQKKAVEINLLLSGSMDITAWRGPNITHDLLYSDDIFVIEPEERIRPVFLSDCILVVVKIPSLPQDKVIEK